VQYLSEQGGDTYATKAQKEKAVHSSVTLAAQTHSFTASHALGFRLWAEANRISGQRAFPSEGARLSHTTT